MVRLLFLLSVLTLATDLWSTWYALTHFPEHIYEANPISSSVFAQAGIAIGTFLVLSFAVLVLHSVMRLRRWIALTVFSIFITTHVIATVNNVSIIAWFHLG